ncbi:MULTISPECIES: DUF1329 domain-containing protein [Cupriavidus]|uniref:DUF1329 domain-containing protein n=1 Tax=Cupriavidus lacunae TaxID=2666307 RepID=A0A370NX08_9BURK|nr:MULTISPECIES: DUF1329 domain-containing protein [Cupriavidus]KWR87850.1 hypothetical protein RM96_22915 [Cupriavidus sp. IDO]RDK10113.1 DUF1329 domain-containing protein [Cupriavidus lacunae]
MKLRSKIAAIASLALIAGTAHAAVSADQAKQLGSTLTAVGAEKAANKDGTIPVYDGGLPTNLDPSGFKKDSGKWVNPFASEKPLFTITAANMDKYGDKLSEASKALFKRFPDYRMDVYKTHRTANWPQFFLDKTLHNATTAKLGKDGMAVEGADGGIPFPIPKSGLEVMYNQQLRYVGTAAKGWVRNIYVDSTGKIVQSGEVQYDQDYPYNWPADWPKNVDRQSFLRMALNFTGPTRAVGDANVWQDNTDFEDKPRRAYAYSASTRRVRLAPDISYDTPIASAGGVMVYDDAYMLSGKMDRWDMKLVGKKEMYIPYSSYDVHFNVKSDQLLGPKFMNPDFVRWELHRVWVVEATLKPGARHVYSKRVFYIDEDWSGAGVADMYDHAGKIYKGTFMGMTQLYDKQVPWSWPYWTYDLSTGAYAIASAAGDGPNLGWFILDKPHANSKFVPDAMQARSGR